jgi:hypothetical protein
MSSVAAITIAFADRVLFMITSSLRFEGNVFLKLLPQILKLFTRRVLKFL